MSITGGCLCGQLRYEIKARKPIIARVCWCRDCQYFGAGTGTANAVFDKAALTATGDGRCSRRGRQRRDDAALVLPEMRDAGVQRG